MILKPRLIRASLLILILIVSGCSRLDATPTTESPASVAAPAASVTAAQSPEPLPTATPTPEPTPISPAVVMTDQSLDERGVLIADLVTLPAPGWVAIYRTADGAVDEVIGKTPLAAGVHENVEVTVDTSLATESLYAGVHMDVGAEGVFEYPGEDIPYPGEPEEQFTVELNLPTPKIEVADQEIAEDGVMTVATVELLEPTWVAIHADEDGQIGQLVGSRFLEAGTHENVSITLDWRRATPVLYAVLHEDDGRAGVLEYPDGDLPILKSGQPIVATFNATYPPEILVYDQPIIDNTISIERVISNGPGYVVIYNEAEGQPGFIIGTAALEDGLNEHVLVSLLPSAITERLFARLHHDSEPGDAFNFPGQDQPVLFNNRMPNATAFRTDIGAHAFIADQKLGDESTVSIDVIVSPVDLWAAIYDDADGQPGDLVGQTWVPAGVNRQVMVEVDDSSAAGTYHLVLYEDLGTREEFDAPGVDIPLTNDDNRPVRIPFQLLP